MVKWDKINPGTHDTDYTARTHSIACIFIYLAYRCTSGGTGIDVGLVTLQALGDRGMPPKLTYATSGEPGMLNDGSPLAHAVSPSILICSTWCPLISYEISVRRQIKSPLKERQFDVLNKRLLLFAVLIC